MLIPQLGAQPALWHNSDPRNSKIYAADVMMWLSGCLIEFQTKAYGSAESAEFGVGHLEAEIDKSLAKANLRTLLVILCTRYTQELTKLMAHDGFYLIKANSTLTRKKVSVTTNEYLTILLLSPKLTEQMLKIRGGHHDQPMDTRADADGALTTPRPGTAAAAAAVLAVPAAHGRKRTAAPPAAPAQNSKRQRKNNDERK